MLNNKMEEEKENNKTSNPRIHINLIEYLKHIIKRYKEEYDIEIKFTEASNILAKRAKKERLFK